MKSNELIIEYADSMEHRARVIEEIRKIEAYSEKHPHCEICGGRIGVVVCRSAGKMQSLCRSCRAKLYGKTTKQMKHDEARMALKAKVNAALND